MTSSGNAAVARAMALSDPRARAKECQATIDRARETIAELIAIRDEAIQAAHGKRGNTIDSLAADLSVKRNVIVDALRNRPRREQR